MEKKWTIPGLLLFLAVMTGCVGIPQRFKDRERPGYWKCTATDIGAGIYFFPIYTVPALIDLPFGIVVDVVYLPFDAMNTRKQEADRAFWLEYFDKGAPLASAEEGRSHISFMGNETVRRRLLQPGVARCQLADLMSIGFAKEVADTQPLDADLITTHIGITNLLHGCLAAQVARNQGTPVEILGLMVSNNVALPQLVGNTNLSVPMIERIAEIARSNITMTATNVGPSRFCGPITHVKLLALSQAALASHPETSPETLQVLYETQTSDDFVILALAKNPRTPVRVLDRIARDGPNPYIKRLSASNLARREAAPEKLK